MSLTFSDRKTCEHELLRIWRKLTDAGLTDEELNDLLFVLTLMYLQCPAPLEVPIRATMEEAHTHQTIRQLTQKEAHAHVH